MNRKLTRETKGMKLYEKAKIVKVGENEFRHQSESDKTKFYSVALPNDLEELGVCTCPDYLFNCLPNKMECKHVISCKAFQRDINKVHSKKDLDKNQPSDQIEYTG